MNADTFTRRTHVWAFPPAEAPHFTIETNKTCNIRCRKCYSRASGVVKTRTQIRDEIDLALSKRKAGIATLLGGEPTLHPDLPRIVADVKSRGLRCQLLTNGRRFLDEDGPALIDALAAAGLDRTLVHIDEGQSHIYPDIDAARRRIFDMLEERGLQFGLSLTVYNESRESITGLIKACAHYRGFDGILAVLARDPNEAEAIKPELENEYRRLQSGLKAEPCAYLPSNLSDEKVQWLVYYLYLERQGKRTWVCPPWLFALADRIHHLFRGCHIYAPKLPTGFRFIAIQTPPELDARTGVLELCRSCPDATIRNGLMTPVCLADRINPLDVRKSALDENARTCWEWAYNHLHELGG